MSEGEKGAKSIERMCEEYLAKHRDFFKSRPGLLQKMDLPHGTATVPSLLDKRMAMLSEEKESIEKKMHGLVKTAGVNEKSSLRVYRVGRDFIHALRRGVEVTPGTCCAVLRRHFKDLYFNVLVFSGETDLKDHKIKMGDQRIAGIVRHAFDSHQMNCGPFSAAERAALFGADAARFNSSLVAPLGGHGDAEPYGLLVLGSDDAARFAPGLGTMFLIQLGEIIEAALGVGSASG